jgi:cob(I)alamin adenosyltransferase
MGIYTKTGDRGTTATLAGDRHPKSHVIFEANGAVDELSAHIGVLRAGPSCLPQHPRLAAFLERLQKDLVPLGAYISSGESRYLDSMLMGPTEFEVLIDLVLEQHPIGGFITPGANELEAACHLLRTVCRRGERRVVDLLGLRPDERALRHLNRLSDLFFALALWARTPFDISFP